MEYVFILRYPFPHNDTFDRSGNQDFGALQEKEKLLVQAISPLRTMFSALSKTEIIIFSSTGRRPASYCHGLVSVVHPFIRACVRKLFLLRTSPRKLLTEFLPNFTGMLLRWSSFKFLQIIVFHEEFWLPWQPK